MLMPWRQTPALVQWLQGPCQKGLCRPSASRSVGMTRVGGLAMVFASKCSPGHLGQVTSSLYASAEGMTPSSDPTLKWHWWWARWSTDFRDTRTGGFPGAMFLDATIQPLGIHIQRRLPLNRVRCWRDFAPQSAPSDRIHFVNRHIGFCEQTVGGAPRVLDGSSHRWDWVC